MVVRVTYLRVNHQLLGVVLITLRLDLFQQLEGVVNTFKMVGGMVLEILHQVIFQQSVEVLVILLLVIVQQLVGVN